MYKGLHVKYPLFSSDFNESWIFSADFAEILKYQVSRTSSWSHVAPCRWMGRQTYRHTYMTKLIINFTILQMRLKTGLFYEPDKSHPHPLSLFQLFLHNENILHQSYSSLFENELLSHYRENLIQYHSIAMARTDTSYKH